MTARRTAADRILDTISEQEFSDHVLDLAAMGGFHGMHVRQSRGVLEGLHSPRRPWPRCAEHDDASGVPDWLLIHPERGVLLLPEMKAQHGVVSPAQRRWLNWLSNVQIVRAPLWRPSDEDAIRACLGASR